MTTTTSNNNNTERLILYFILVLGIIAITIWSIFFIQMSDLINKSTEIIETSNQTQYVLNQTELMLHENLARDKQTEHEDKSRDKQSEKIMNITRQIILEHHYDLMDYIIKTNNTTDKIIKENSLLLKNIIDYIGIDINNINR